MRRKFTLDRGQFPRGASYAAALPLLPSLPGGLRAEAATGSKPKRLICVGTQLGFYKPEFFAEGKTPRLIEPLEAAGLAGDFTTISGLDHKGPTGNGHELVYALYTGHVVRSISLDQYAAPVLGKDKRYESLQLCAGYAQQKAWLSFSSSATQSPCEPAPSESGASADSKYWMRSSRCARFEKRRTNGWNRKESRFWIGASSSSLWSRAETA